MALGYAPVYADGTPVRVRGSVVSLDGSKLVVRAKDGKDVSVSLADNFAALAVVKSSMADIKQGTFIGTAIVTQPDSTLRSVVKDEAAARASECQVLEPGTTRTTTGAATTTTTTTITSASKRWYPDHAVYNATMDELKAMPEFKY
jgi:hypothetical protein